MILYDISTLLEVLTVMLCANMILGKWDRTFLRYGGIIIIIGQIAATHFTFMDIPVWIQLLIIIAWIRCLYVRHSWRQILYTGLVSYGGMLLFLQALAMLQIMDYYTMTDPYLLGLIMNGIVFVLMLLIYGGVRLIRKKYPSVKSNQAMRITLCAASIAMMIICQQFRKEVLQTYRMESRWVSLVIVLTLLACAVWMILDGAKKNRAMEKKQHDYVRALRYLRENANTHQEVIQQLELESETEELLLELEPALQQVLRYYGSLCRQQGIDLRITATPMLFSTGLSEKDALTVLGNLLDNAIRAVNECDLSERWIEWRMQYDDRTIRITNPYLPTAKTPQHGHGYGQQIVQEALSEYHVQFEAFPQEEVYRVILKWGVV